MNQQVTETYKTDTLTEKRIIRQLALEWIQSKLPVDDITFVDCLNVLDHLQTSTGNIRKTEAIFEIVFNQAHELSKSSEWFAHELQFETLALTVGNRQELARLYLNHSNPVNDTALDEYNERLTRLIHN